MAALSPGLDAPAAPGRATRPDVRRRLTRPMRPARTSTPDGQTSLRYRLGLVFAVVAVLVLLIAAGGTAALVRLSDGRHALVERLDPATLQTANLLTAYVDEETGVRGYVLSGDTRFLEPYVQGQAAAGPETAELRKLLSPGGPAQRLLASALAAAGAWQASYAGPAVAATAAGGRAAFASDAALARSKALFDQVRGGFASLQHELAAERARSRSHLNAIADQLAFVLALAVLVAMVAVAVIWRSLHSWVIGPLDALRTETRTVTAGDLRHQVSLVGPPEVVELAADVEAMRRRILEEVAAVEAAGQELAARNEDLARSNVELEQFAYVASHDLQEPLRKVTSFCQLLQERYGGQLDERADQYIEFAVDGAKRMQVLINDLLSFSRVGRTTEGFEPVALDDCLSVALRNLAAAIEDTGADVHTTGPLPTVDGDRGLLVALFQNLVGNAIKFRSEAAPVVEITAAQADGVWVFSVTDNGIGIEPRFADRIFVIFQRLHGRDAYAGTGIGLALCKKIVEFHGGRIWLDPDHHPGARLCFTLPLPPTTTEHPDDQEGTTDEPG